MTKINKYKYILIVAFALVGFIAAKAYAQTAYPTPLVISHNLSQGSKSSEVSWLQQFLKDRGFFTFTTITGYFGPLTKKAVMDFQKSYNISPVGIVGPITRAKILELTQTMVFMPGNPAPLLPEVIQENHYVNSPHGGHVTYTLSVSKSGSGSGNVINGSPKINCGLTCINTFNKGSAVILTATADSGSTFTGWSGACTGTGTCSLTINADTSVTANFSSTTNYNLTIVRSGAGAGTVTSTPAGINCGATCSSTYASGTMVTLTAQSSSGSAFGGWSGACSGMGTCTITMNSAQIVNANFTNTTPALVSISITPSNSQLPKTINQQFTATGHYDDSSTADITASAVWDTSDHNVATISNTGLGTGVNAGTTQVIASVNGVIGSTSLTVTNAVLVAIAISPSNPAVARDSSLQLSAIGTFSDGSSADITNQATWTSQSNSIATVNNTDQKGNVTGVTGGSTIIQANFASVTGTATLFVGN